MLFDRKATYEQRQEQLAKFLAPIEGEQPAGPDLRKTPEGNDRISAIEQAYRKCIADDRALENARVFASGPDAKLPPSPDWNSVISLVMPLIEKDSKDLYAASVAAEAGFRQAGIDGLSIGFELITGLIENFWPNTPPEQNEDDTSDQQFSALRHIYSFRERLPKILDTQIELTPRGATQFNYAQAVNLVSVADNIRQKRIEAGTRTLEMIKSEARQSTSFGKAIFESLQRCHAAGTKLEETLQAKCKAPDGRRVFPPRVEEVLTKLRGLQATLHEICPPGSLPEEGSAAADGGSAASVDDAGAAVTTAGGAPAASFVLTAGSAASREAAFAQLKQIADFFRKTEPHSPLSYALEQAIRWGRMTLPELLQELVGDESARRALFERTGIPERKEE